VKVNDRNVVFLDTPGHEAFTMMRARGARVTDVVILVVAADDGVMPQTEGSDRSRQGGGRADPRGDQQDRQAERQPRARQEGAGRSRPRSRSVGRPDGHGRSLGEEEGEPRRAARDDPARHRDERAQGEPEAERIGTVLEAKLDKGRGPVATILVQDGTLNVGDTFIAGTIVGKVRALIDDRGRQLKHAPPSTPVEVLGLGGLPSPGDAFQALADATKARQIALFRQTQAKEKALGGKGSRLTLESLQQQIAEGGMKELPVIVKADVQGSAEVLGDTLTKMTDDKVKIRIIHSGVGAINESDVSSPRRRTPSSSASTSGPIATPRKWPIARKVDVRLHSVIYNVVDEMKKAMTGLLDPTFKEVRIGAAQVREVFKVPKFGTIAGCMVTEGRIARSGDTQARLLRDNVVIHEGKIGSLRRFKDDVSGR
jgi:translation initiation factor IF-2